MSDADRRAAARANAAAPATILGLHDRIKERLAVVADRFWLLDTKSGQQRVPRILDGWLPPKDPDEDEFPFLIVRPKSGVDSPQGADENGSIVVDIIIGTYSDTDDGWFDVANLIDAIRADIGAAPTIEGTAFEQVGPMAWQIPEQQPRPEWFGTVTTIWQLPRPQRVEASNPED